MGSVVKREVNNFFVCLNTPGIRRKSFFDPPRSLDKIFHRSARYLNDFNLWQSCKPWQSWFPEPVSSKLKLCQRLSLPSHEKSSCPFCTKPNRWFAPWWDQDGLV